MGAYLSSPVTDKESEEGYADALAYGLSAMQGWRVSMEDAHIAELDLEPDTKTSLFAVFDGHGGRAVSQYCAAHLTEEFVRSAAYRRGDLAAAISEAYFRLDELLESAEGRAELRQLVSSSKPTEGAALFTDVETKLAGAAQAHDDQAQSSHAADALPAAVPQRRGTNRMHSSDREQLEVEASKAMKKLGSSKDFMESHLMRASVLTPLDDDPPRPEGATSQNASGRHTGMPSIESGDMADAAAVAGQANGGSSGAAGDEGEEHHALGMGATAVSVVVRGNRVVVANTGDSRCVLSKRGQARALTLDHKPILFEEAKRIIKAGGFVRDNRINGALNVSRTIGDLDFKRNAELSYREQMVVATPDIEEFTLEDGDEFLIVACDGIWDVLTNQEAVDFVRKRLKAALAPPRLHPDMDATLAAAGMGARQPQR
ncbi:hypothetical protein D9Q98_002583 [Chlorella vulgaris]|uniref:protein-serine/threonine phosphatase n=1 Tax=Chlorella vulgaris TaxID=3077 RepID=A0A9D4TTH8_CHLVU|nr:hypothetical protein D9Q98_002583 [Chlorella vulgaris]